MKLINYAPYILMVVIFGLYMSERDSFSERYVTVQDTLFIILGISWVILFILKVRNRK